MKPHPRESNFKYTENSKRVSMDISKTSGNKRIFYVDNDISEDFIYSFADCIVTVAGSISFEAPPHGIPVITASKGIMNSTSRSTYSKNIDEYKYKLNNIHKINKLSQSEIFDAKIIFIFITVLRNVATDLNISNINNGLKNQDQYSDIEAYKLIDNWFSNIESIKKTDLYCCYKHMINNDFNELINYKRLRCYLD